VYAGMSDAPVLVACGGPVGVITALALAQRGIPVRLFEAAERVNDAPRASTLHPATLDMLAGVGLLDEVTARGLLARTFQFWDRPTRSVVAEFDHAVLKNDTAYPFVVQTRSDEDSQAEKVGDAHFDFSFLVRLMEASA
jgi:3-(3-hydroxy-phenyl)propionate hydroxylase